MNLKSIIANRKTTAAGVGAIATAVAGICVVVGADYIDPVTLIKALTGLISAVAAFSGAGLVAARDGDKTSRESGAE